ncbi:hypothetical protein DSM25558_4737 [Agrobacterium sp. DSM 25558]|nr:hypothetical protein DSM25558_4737 [Agrobacterium sp. DSM 25558]
MAMPAMPRAGLVMIEAEFALGCLEAIFDCPTVIFDGYERLSTCSGRAPSREECEVAIADIATDQQATHPKRVRPANTFRELSQPGDDLALVPALMLGLDRELRGWYGSHGDYFRH